MWIGKEIFQLPRTRLISLILDGYTLKAYQNKNIRENEWLTENQPICGLYIMYCTYIRRKNNCFSIVHWKCIGLFCFFFCSIRNSLFWNISIRSYNFESAVHDFDLTGTQLMIKHFIEPNIQFKGRFKTNVGNLYLCNKRIYFATDHESICFFEFEKLHKHTTLKNCFYYYYLIFKIIYE